MTAHIALLLHGGRGRMGRAIAEVAAQRDGVHVASVIGRGDPLPDTPPAGAVLVDFSTPAALPVAVAWAREHRVPLLSGTTGLGDREQAALDALAGDVPVLYATNTSLGVAVLRRLVRQAAASLPASFVAELVEMHHDQKVDAPSGTACTLVETIQEARGGGRVVGGREGHTGARSDDEIGVFALRGGTVAGEHTVHFIGPDERIELTHRAGSRAIFARGAVEAARWLVGQSAGRYTMDDVLGDPR